jgi:transketolase
VGEQKKIYPDSAARKAMGITGFTLPTMYRWVRSSNGIKKTMHPFQKGHFLGSGPGDMVLKQAGLDGESQFEAIMAYVKK